MAKNWNITSDSEPDLDSWGFDDYWTVNEWVEWHKKMKAKFGLQKANMIFIEWWKKQTVGANPLNNRTNANFKKYAKDNGFLSSIYSELEKTALSIVSPGFQVTKSALNTATNAAAAAENTSKVLKWLLPTLLIVAAAGLSIWAYNKYAAK